MKRFTDFIKNWGGFIALCLIDIALIALFIISECKTDSAFLRIIYGILTLCPVGALLPWLTKRGLDNSKEG